MVKKRKTPASLLFQTFMYIVLVFTVVVSVYPILWVIFSSFKSNAAILSSPFSLPDTYNFKAYTSVVKQYSFGLYAFNSLLISSQSTALSLLFFSMGAYVFSKFRFPFKNLLYVLLTITLLVPGHTKTQPIFSLIMRLNLYDTKTGLVLVYLSGGVAMSLFILRATFMGIPMELNEAAEIDGAGFIRTFLQINMPLAKNGLTTAGVLMFLGNWNEYYFAALLTSSPSNRTMPVALGFFNQAFSYDYTRMFAALTLVILPGIIIYMFAQGQVQASVSSTGIKG